MVMAIISLLIPFVVLYRAVDIGILDMQGKIVFVFILFWIILAFAGWVGFQQWWDRRTKVGSTSFEGDDFTATPAFSHFIQTFGEWFGTWLGMVGCGYAILSTFLLGDSNGYLSMHPKGLIFAMMYIVNRLKDVLLAIPKYFRQPKILRTRWWWIPLVRLLPQLFTLLVVGKQLTPNRCGQRLVTIW